MKIGYTDIVIELSQKLCQALLEQEPGLVQKVHELDGEVNKILRRVGFFVVSLVLAELSNQVTLEHRFSNRGAKEKAAQREINNEE